jgi:hypothetical protein
MWLALNSGSSSSSSSSSSFVAKEKRKRDGDDRRHKHHRHHKHQKRRQQQHIDREEEKEKLPAESFLVQAAATGLVHRPTKSKSFSMESADDTFTLRLGIAPFKGLYDALCGLHIRITPWNDHDKNSVIAAREIDASRRAYASLTSGISHVHLLDYINETDNKTKQDPCFAVALLWNTRSPERGGTGRDTLLNALQLRLDVSRCTIKLGCVRFLRSSQNKKKNVLIQQFIEMIHMIQFEFGHSFKLEYEISSASDANQRQIESAALDVVQAAYYNGVYAIPELKVIHWQGRSLSIWAGEVKQGGRRPPGTINWAHVLMAVINNYDDDDDEIEEEEEEEKEQQKDKQIFKLLSTAQAPSRAHLSDLLQALKPDSNIKAADVMVVLFAAHCYNMGARFLLPPGYLP